MLKFNYLSKIFYEIEAVNSRNLITEKLAELFSNCTPTEAQIITYLSLGTLRPPYEIMQFNLAEKTVRKVVAQVLDKPLEYIDEKVKETGDLGELLKDLNNNITHELSIEDIYKKLIDIESISGQGSVQERSQARPTRSAHALP